MSTNKCYEAWKIIKNYRLEFDNKCNDILCIICQKVLINAHSGPCGCRYCLECITTYLNGEEKICPGNTDFCKDEVININKNVLLDQPTNMKILKTIVKCPEKKCIFKDELRNIREHMTICDFQSVNCPYMNMGCNECRIVGTEIKNHMLDDIFSHTKMLFELIDNLKNDIKILKEDNAELKKSNKDLTKHVNDLQLKYENEEIKMKLKEIEKETVEEQKYCENSKLNCERINEEGKDEPNKIENKSTSIQGNANDLKEELNVSKKERESTKEVLFNNGNEAVIRIDEINKIVTDWKLILNESDKLILNLENEIRMLKKNQEQQNFGAFVWRVNKWKEKTEQSQARINEFYISDSFYSHRNGYKLRLSVCPNGSYGAFGTHLSVFCRIVLGEYDDILSWPFQHEITFELINQHTSQIYTVNTITHNNGYTNESYYNKDNRKPSNHYGYYLCGFYKFISLEELSNNLSVVDNDQILIRCRVKIID